MKNLMLAAPLLIALTPLVQPASAFQFRGQGFAAPHMAWQGPGLGGGGLAFQNFQTGRKSGSRAPMAPNHFGSPRGFEQEDSPQSGPGRDQSTFGHGVTTPVIRFQSIANVRLRFSLIAANGAACVSRSINPDQAISLPDCGDTLHWHDGRSFEDMTVQPMRVYRFSWSGSKWAVEDVTAELN